MRRPSLVTQILLALLMVISSVHALAAAGDVTADYKWPKEGTADFFANSSHQAAADWSCAQKYPGEGKGGWGDSVAGWPPVLTYRCYKNPTFYPGGTLTAVTFCPVGFMPGEGSLCVPSVAPTVPATYGYGPVGSSGQQYLDPLEACKGEFYGADVKATASVVPKGDGSYYCTATAGGKTVSGNDIPTNLYCPPEYHQDLSDLKTCVSDKVAKPDASQGPGIPNITPIPPVGPACAPGMVLGQVNGVDTCLTAGTPSTQAPVTKTTTSTPPVKVNNADGSTTETSSKTVSNTNPDGTISSTTTTTTVNTASDGTVTTTTTSQTTDSGTPGGGGGVKQSSGTGDSGDKAGGKVLYEAKKDTVAKVMGEFKNQIMSAPMVTAATSFLSIDSITGSCPSWTLTVGFMNFSHDMGQYFCGPMMTSVLETMAVGLQIVGSMIGFSLAFL
jgi:hypothetical protein